MFQFFGKDGKKSGKRGAAQANAAQKSDQDIKAEYLLFREQVVETKNAVI